MKLHFSLLQKIIDLPVQDPLELRHTLDDLGLEVKDIEGDGASTVFNIETLANRGDHLSVLGVAREISARYLTPLNLPAVTTDLSDRKVSIPVVNSTEKCLRYALMELTLPERMSSRPEVSAILGENGGIHPIVDLLNYILIEVGQPMHAFDRDKVEGEIRVELSSTVEKVVALDGKEYSVPPNSILIKDKKKIIAIAGVIGCANSMVSSETKRVLIESATFDPVTIRKTARGMGISTDASYSFERGCDPDGAAHALKRLLNLLGTGGVSVVGATLIEGQPLPKGQITIELAIIRKQLNLPRLEAVEITSRLKNLGFGIQYDEATKVIKVGIPSWRIWDIKNPEDIIEEIARILSLSRIKAELPPLDYEMPTYNPIELLFQKIEACLSGNGFYEVITKAFYSASEVEILKLLDPKLPEQHVAIKNAVDGAYSHLKVTNIIHLAKLAEQNHRKGIASIKLYELGRLFSSSQDEKKGHELPYQYEKDTLTLAISGRWSEHEWQKPENRETLVRKFKGVIEGLIESLGHKLVVGESFSPLLHPGIQASIKIGRSKVGLFGLIHPALKERLDLKQDLLYAELNADILAKSISDRVLKEVSDLPVIRRDITLKIAPEAAAGNIMRYISDLKPANLQTLSIVDQFKKEEENFRRVTYRMTFQSIERTLESSEIDNEISAILKNLDEKHSIQMI